MATAILAAMNKNSSTATLGTLTITGPINMRLMTANGSDSSLGTAQGATTVASGSNGGEISQIASWGGTYGGSGVLCVASGAIFPTTGTVSVAASGSTNALVSYTGVSGNTLTGCAYVSGSATGTVATGGAVVLCGTVSMGTAGSGSIASNGAVSWTGMPSCTLTGMEQWESSGTPQRTFWAPWASGSIVVASANTFTCASGALTDGLA
jgi:hypothetical protein